MNQISLRAAACAALIVVSSAFAVKAQAPAAAAPKPAAYRAPRTTDGQPDLQGVWQVRNTAAYDLEDHSAGLGVPAGRGVVVDPADGKIPYTPEGLMKRDANRAKATELDPLNKCYLPGPTRMIYLPFPIQIFQTADFAVIASEFAHSVRTVHLTGEHPDEIEFWMGDSRGKWEGETLVVDARNTNAGSWLDRAGNHHSADLHIVERFHRTGPDTIEYEATFEDSKTYTKPWKIRVPLYRREPGTQLLEYECHVYLEDAGKKNTEGK
jgi:hypothetical protein